MQKQQAPDIDLDQHNNPLMTAKTLQHYAQQEGSTLEPYLHQKLHLKQKGFLIIMGQSIGKYSNISVLLLSNNQISKMEGLGALISLTSLVISNNRISKMEGINHLSNLTMLDLSGNKIQVVEGINNLSKLQSLNLANNLLSNRHSIKALSAAPNLSTLNLSENQLENTEKIFQTIIQNKRLSCLYLKSTLFSRGFRNYRKKIIANLPRLKFLDDRPIMSEDHRTAEAWLQGGIQAQKLIKEKMLTEKNSREQLQRHQKKHEKDVNELVASKQKAESVQLEKKEQAKMLNRYVQEQRLMKQRIQEQQQRQLKKVKSKLKAVQIQPQVHNAQSKNTTSTQPESSTIISTVQYQQQTTHHRQISIKWKPKYQKILERLLLKYKFDFSEVQPSFNMILSAVNKKLMKSVVRFEIEELRFIWTEVQKKKRQMMLIKV